MATPKTASRRSTGVAIRKVLQLTPEKFRPSDDLKPARLAMSQVVAARMVSFGQAGHAGGVEMKSLADMVSYYTASV